jgi:hypothetical protein
MKEETPKEKWNRVQQQIRRGITEGYPNSERKGCPGHEVIVRLAVRAAGFDEAIEDDPQWHHVTHCSPCYSEYLDEFGNYRKSKASRQTK